MRTSRSARRLPARSAQRRAGPVPPLRVRPGAAAAPARGLLLVASPQPTTNSTARTITALIGSTYDVSCSRVGSRRDALHAAGPIKCHRPRLPPGEPLLLHFARHLQPVARSILRRLTAASSPNAGDGRSQQRPNGTISPPARSERSRRWVDRSADRCSHRGRRAHRARAAVRPAA